MSETGMQGGVYAQFTNISGSVGLDSREGLVITAMMSGSIGLTVGAARSVSVNPLDWDYIDGNPNDKFLEASRSIYVGGGTPSGAPIPVTFQALKNVETGALLVQIGIGLEGVKEAGIYVEYPKELVDAMIGSTDEDVFLNPIFKDYYATAGEWASVNQHLSDYPLDLIQRGYIPDELRCFPAGTLITLSDHTQKPIENIRHGDIVLSHDKNGNLIPSIVDKLFTNTTDAFIRLSFDDRDDLIATPGHHFLTETGDYMEIGHMARIGGGQVRIVDTDGSIITAKAERIVYSAETADMFEQAA